MCNSAGGIRLRIKIYNRGADPPRYALSRPDFDGDDDNDRVCFALDNIYIVQSDMVTQSDIRTEWGSNRLFQNVIKIIKSGYCKQCSDAERFRTTEGRLRYPQPSNISGSNVFHSIQTKTCGDGQISIPVKNSTNRSPIDSWWPGFLRYVSKWKECQENKPSLGKTVST